MDVTLGRSEVARVLGIGPETIAKYARENTVAPSIDATGTGTRRIYGLADLVALYATNFYRAHYGMRLAILRPLALEIRSLSDEGLGAGKVWLQYRAVVDVDDVLETLGRKRVESGYLEEATPRLFVRPADRKNFERGLADGERLVLSISLAPVRDAILAEVAVLEDERRER